MKEFNQHITRDAMHWKYCEGVGLRQPVTDSKQFSRFFMGRKYSHNSIHSNTSGKLLAIVTLLFQWSLYPSLEEDTACWPAKPFPWKEIWTWLGLITGRHSVVNNNINNNININNKIRLAAMHK